MESLDLRRHVVVAVANTVVVHRHSAQPNTVEAISLVAAAVVDSRMAAVVVDNRTAAVAVADSRIVADSKIAVVAVEDKRIAVVESMIEEKNCYSPDRIDIVPEID